MKLAKVYKLTREDNLEYIGISLNMKSRLWQHNRSDRFKDMSIINVIILGEFENYEDAEIFETTSIEKYNTFHGGLNKTYSGKGNHHNSKKFTTRGKCHSEETKRKIGEKSIKRNAGKKLEEWYKAQPKEYKEQRARKMSDRQKGVPRKSKFPSDMIEQILRLYVSRPAIDEVGKIQQNGLRMSYDQAFSNLYCKQFQMSSVGLRNIIQGKLLVWRELYEKIVNMKS